MTTKTTMMGKVNVTTTGKANVKTTVITANATMTTAARGAAHSSAISPTTLKIWIDGELVQDWTQPGDWDQKTKKLGSGTIALQAHDPGSKVCIRKVEVMELP